MNKLIASGIEGLDSILHGGFPKGSSILLDGAPGTGKTILGMQFLYQGATSYDEPGIYITFEEFPDQIYKDMKAFNWDLKELEKQNKLRVICITPEILMDQMKRPDGIFDKIINEINCKRVVIDSLNLFHFGMDDLSKKRKVIYTLRNILRKKQLTTLLIHEQTSFNKEEIPFVSYVVDGVIRLSLKEQNEIYRKRTLEVLKMRGCNIMEGEHIYRLNEAGIILLPALSMMEDKVMINNIATLSTGITSLDEILGGGLPEGSTFILDTNSKANYKYLVSTLMTTRILAGDHCVFLLSSLTTIAHLQHIFHLYGVDIKEMVKQKKIFFIEHYDRPIPEGFEGSVYKVGHLENHEYNEFLKETLMPSMNKPGEKWFTFYDLNTLVSQRGKEYMNSCFVEVVAHTSGTNITSLALCNFKEMGEEMASFLERTSNGVFKTWVDGNYQFFQLIKSPNGNMSYPLLVESIRTKPFIRLI